MSRGGGREVVTTIGKSLVNLAPLTINRLADKTASI